MADLFVSYSRKDLEFVRGLHRLLTARGKDVWVDWEDIPPTAEWEEEIARAVDSADAFLFVLSPDSVASRVCARELERAIESHKRLIPVLFREVAEPVPDALARLNWIYTRDGDDLAHAVNTIIGAAETDLERARAHSRLLVRASEWEARGRDASYLLRGSDLVDAEALVTALVEGTELESTAQQSSYVVASRQAATRRQRVTGGAVALGLVVAVVLAVLALIQRNQAVREGARAERQAQIAQSRELAALAEGQLSIDPELSILLAREGAKLAPTNQIADALRAAIPRSHLRALLSGHSDAVSVAEFGPDGSQVVTGSWDGTVRLWNARSGAAVATVARDLGQVHDVAFSPDGRRVAAAVFGRTFLWDLDARGDEVPLAGASSDSEINVVAFSPSGALLASGSGSGEVKVWDANDGSLVASMRDAATHVGALAFGPDGRTLASAPGHFITGAPNILTSLAGPPRLWDVARGRLVATLEISEADVVTDIAFAPDGRLVVGATSKGARLWDLHGRLVRTMPAPGTFVVGVPGTGNLLATGGLDGVARVWDSRTGAELATFRGHDGAVLSVAFRHDGKFVVSTGSDRTARVWVALTGREASVLRGHEGWVLGGSFEPDGTRVVTASLDRTARVWEPGVQEGIVELKGHLGPVTVATFAADGTRLATGELQEAPLVRVWDPETGREVATTESHHEVVRSIAFSPGGELLLSLSGGMDTRIHVADGRTGATVLLYDAQGIRGASSAVWAPDGRRILSAGADGIARLWDARSGRTILTLDDRDEEPDRIALSAAAPSPDGTRIVTAGSFATGPLDDPDIVGILSVWDGATGGRLRSRRDLPYPITTAAFSADGRTILTNSGNGATLWDPETLHAVTELRGHTAPVSVASFSPEGSRIVTASTFELDPVTFEPLPGDLNVRIWDARSGTLLRTLPQPAAVRDVAFNPAGTRLAVATDLGGSVWDVAPGRQIAALPGLPEGASDAEFSPDGRYLALAGSDGIARIYSAETFAPLDALIQLADRRVTRGLTPDERRAFLHEPG
ncbi:MAG TPA: TIR domain-containing protein [Actinomycetota bacterium]|nr:TIR domain-containing protein [Actinomycetota bacterium]